MNRLGKMMNSFFEALCHVRRTSMNECVRGRIARWTKVLEFSEFVVPSFVFSIFILYFKEFTYTRCLHSSVRVLISHGHITKTLDSSKLRMVKCSEVPKLKVPNVQEVSENGKRCGSKL